MFFSNSNSGNYFLPTRYSRYNNYCFKYKIWNELLLTSAPVTNWDIKLIKLPKKKNCLINYHVSYPSFISNEFIDFSESMWICPIFFTILKTNLKILKNERNVTSFGCAFLTRFHITHNNFSGDWSNSCSVIVSIFFQKRYFPKRKKNAYGFWKINELIWNEKK